MGYKLENKNNKKKKKKKKIYFIKVLMEQRTLDIREDNLDIFSFVTYNIVNLF